MVEIAPSILAADPLRLGEEADRMLKAGADLLHLDIMDAHFVPNLSFGPHVTEGLRRAFPREVLDVHLMMTNPEVVLEAFIRAGASEVTVHAEIGPRAGELLKEIRAMGARSGVSVKPGTPAEAILPLIKDADLVLIMTVEPGFGGQSILSGMLDKARILRQAGFSGTISADGGITPDNASLAVARGVNRLVMGSALYRSADPAADIRRCHSLAAP